MKSPAGSRSGSWVRCWCLLSLGVLTRALELSDLFRFGEEAGDAQLPPGPDSTAELPLSRSMLFFSGSEDKVHINRVQTTQASASLQEVDRTRGEGLAPVVFMFRLVPGAGGQTWLILHRLSLEDEEAPPPTVLRSTRSSGNVFILRSVSSSEAGYLLVELLQLTASCQTHRGAPIIWCQALTFDLRPLQLIKAYGVLGEDAGQFQMMAALLGDLDNSDGRGKVFFREDSSPDVLRRARQHVRQAFPRDEEVEPHSTLIVTWLDMAAQGTSGRGDGVDVKRNTFQLVVAFMPSSSCAILLYPRDGLQFLSTSVGGEEKLLEAGFNEGLVSGWFWNTKQGTYFKTTTDDEASIQELTEKTNSGQRGVWVYEIGASPVFLSITPGMVSNPSEGAIEPTEPPVTTQPPVTMLPRQPDEEQEVDFSVFESQVTTTAEAAPEDEEVFPTEAPSEYSQVTQKLRPPHLGMLNQRTKSRIMRNQTSLSLNTLNLKLSHQHTPALKQLHQDPQTSLSRDTPSLSLFNQDTPSLHLRNLDTLQYSHSILTLIQSNLGTPTLSLSSQCHLIPSPAPPNRCVFAYNLETCAHNRHKCSSFADCRDYSNGYCCHCKPGFYGNGKDCVAEGVGPSLQPLSSLGGVIGWAFALEQPGYENGFSLIGGEFSRQAEVIFQPGNERLSIKQQFKGIDEHDHLVVSTEMEGRVPSIQPGSSVQINPYKEIYQYDRNLITSSSNRDYTITSPDGTVETRSYQWRQTITFQSCPHDEATRVAPSTQQLSVDQIFVMFDSDNLLIRYAMSNKIGSS
ncbi:hypothetical protein INR49_010312, partial [Caranx melampygus]